MNAKPYKLLFTLVAAVLVSACEPDAGSVSRDASPGSADFSVYVAVGDSLTAGYADGALYRQIQQNSFPAIFARQIAQAGGGEFLQPLMEAAATGSLTFMGGDLGRVDRLVLVATGNPASPVTPVPIVPTQSTAIDIPLANAGGFHNIGVPGAKSFHLGVMGYGNPLGLPNANPYFARFSSDPANASMLGDAAGLAPTFFTLWIGANDVLLYALDGGLQDPAYGTGTENITDPTVFTPSFNGALATLKTPGNKGVVANIPDISTIPHFNTVPYDAIPLDAATAATLNVQVADTYDLVLDAAITGGLPVAEADRRRIRYQAGQNPILISDETLTDLSASFGGVLAPFIGLAQARPATPDDYILLAASGKLGEEDTPGNPLSNWGVTLPLEDADVLIDFEYAQVEVARQAYNATIKAAADADDDILFYDAAARLEELNRNGISYGTGGVTSAYVTGGFYSADGVHPTARGYAVIANELMSLIESGFGANLPAVNPGDYTTVFYQ